MTDTHAATELKLFIDNDAALNRQIFHLQGIVLLMLSDPWLSSVPRVGLVKFRPEDSTTTLDFARASDRAGVGYETIRGWVRSGRLSSTTDAFGVAVVQIDQLDQIPKSRGGRPLGSPHKDVAPGVRSGRNQDGSLVALELAEGYVRCKCDCGSVVDVTRYQFKYRMRCRTQCPSKKKTIGGPKRSQSFVGNYNSLIRGTRQNRGLAVSLTYDEYVAIRSPGICSYCKGPIKRQNIGLDRLDNEIGYHKFNVVACCALCNVARGYLLTPDEFKAALATRAAKLPPGTPLWDTYKWGHVSRELTLDKVRK